MRTELRLKDYYLSKEEIDIEFLGEVIDKEGAKVIKDAIDEKSDSNHKHDSDYLKLSGGTITGDLIATTTNKGIITANKFKTPTGTSDKFLKADGSLDSNAYSLVNHTHNEFTDIDNNINQLNNNMSSAQGNITQLTNNISSAQNTITQLTSRNSSIKNGHTHDTPDIISPRATTFNNLSFPSTTITQDDFNRKVDDKIGTIDTTLSGKADINHNTPQASDSIFGHVKLSDTYTSSEGNANNGLGASQEALATVYNKLTSSNYDLKNAHTHDYTPSSHTSVVADSNTLGHVKIGKTANTVSAGNHTHDYAPSLHTHNEYLKTEKTGYINGILYNNEDVPEAIEQTIQITFEIISSQWVWNISINNLQTEQDLYVDGISISDKTRTQNGFSFKTSTPEQVTILINAVTKNNGIYSGDIKSYKVNGNNLITQGNVN